MTSRRTFGSAPPRGVRAEHAAPSEAAAKAPTGTSGLLTGALGLLGRRRGGGEEAAVAEPEARRTDLGRFAEEFERSGRGWFWETDESGQLSYITAAVADRLGLDPDAVGQETFVSLFSDEISEGDTAIRSERTVGFHLSVRTPFSEVVVRPRGQERAWWSVSGRPLFDDMGGFLGFRGTGADLSEARYAEAEVRRLARHDSLTGLFNRSAMTKALDEALRTSRGTGNADATRCALMLLDLDRFKLVNDSHGHMTGDELLKQVAKRLQEVAGKVGHVGRLGGDEFKIVIPNPPSMEELGEIAERCISYVSIPYRIGGRQFQVGASVGIALATGSDCDPDLLMRRADLALYAAKGNGRGTHRFFEAKMQTVAQDRQALEQDLKHAIGAGELELYYQPVVSSASEELTGFEALLRWQHPTQGFISPALVIPIAEETGLIVPLGEWAIRAACAAAARMPPHIRVAVNLSPIQFSNPNLPNVIVSALASAGLPASRLELEITEGVFLEQDPSTQERFDRLKAIGVRLALDDFGTGYASLGYLKTAPFDKIKIDQSFVRGATHQGSRNMRILSAIVGLAQSLGMDTTAEGAETFDELQLIRELGCSHVQGYIFGRPMPLDQALELAGASTTVEVNGFAKARPARHRLIRKGALLHEDAAYEALVRNISDGGALIETERGFPPGTAVMLEVSGATLPAEVRWTQGNRVGLRFTEAFDLHRLAAARAPAPSVRVAKT